MEFDITFQRDVLRLMLNDEAFGLAATKYLQPGFFQIEVFGWLFKLYAFHVKEYATFPSETVLVNELRRLPAEKRAAYEAEVMGFVANQLVPNSDYLRAKLKEFVEMNIFVEAHRSSAKLFSDGQRTQAYEIMRSANETISQVSFEGPQRQWFFDELPERQRDRFHRATSQKHVPRITGIDDLDRRTDGGVHEGELWCVFAYAKRCKSTFLINQGFFSTRVHRMPTLHIQLEGLPHQVADKYDACFSRELYIRVKRGEMSNEAFSYLQNEYSQLRRKLVIRCFNEWDLSMENIFAEIEELRAVGFEPRTLILDYVDLLKSRDKRCDSETQHQLDACRDLKRLINSRGYAGWSAWQAQRPKLGANLKEHVLTQSNVADAYAKVRVVDSWGSLNATDDEMERDEMRIYWEGHRDAPVGVLYRVKNELATMRMVESAERIDYLPASTGTAS